MVRRFALPFRATKAGAWSTCACGISQQQAIEGLTGGREHFRQIELRRQNCGSSYYAIYEMPSGSCHPPTAKPGQSQHQLGLAIDFANCSSRGTACYRWLAANASRFGYYNLPSEAWHWSTTGR